MIIYKLSLSKRTHQNVDHHVVYILVGSLTECLMYIIMMLSTS